MKWNTLFQFSSSKISNDSKWQLRALRIWLTSTTGRTDFLEHFAGRGNKGNYSAFMLSFRRTEHKLNETVPILTSSQSNQDDCEDTDTPTSTAELCLCNRKLCVQCVSTSIRGADQRTLSHTFLLPQGSPSFAQTRSFFPPVSHTLTARLSSHTDVLRTLNTHSRVLTSAQRAVSRFEEGCLLTNPGHTHTLFHEHTHSDRDWFSGA